MLLDGNDLVVRNYLSYINHKIHYAQSNTTCYIILSSDLLEFYARDCSHNRNNMWCSRIVSLKISQSLTPILAIQLQILTLL